MDTKIELFSSKLSPEQQARKNYHLAISEAYKVFAESDYKDHATFWSAVNVASDIYVNAKLAIAKQNGFPELKRTL